MINAGMMMQGQTGAPRTGGSGTMGPSARTPDMGAMMDRVGTTEQRMNMMQMMMDQMLRHQEFILEDRNDGDS